MPKKSYYAVRKGVAPGIYRSWAETEAQVRGYPGARYKGFASEADARSWLEQEENGAAARPRAETLPAAEHGIVVYTDGGALNNPGPGGYGALIMSDEGLRELSAGFRLTTNNRMELMACIAALRQLRGCRKPIVIHADSSYVVNGISKGWARAWRRNGWVKSDGKPVLNRDLWQELLGLTEDLDVRFEWVRGHAGNRFNERCDQLAVSAARGESLPRDEGYEACAAAP